MRNMRIIGLFWALSVLSMPFVTCAQGVVKKSEGVVKNEGAAKSENSKKGIISSCSERFRSLSPQTKVKLAIAGALPVYLAGIQMSRFMSSSILPAILGESLSPNELIGSRFFSYFAGEGAALAIYLAGLNALNGKESEQNKGVKNALTCSKFSPLAKKIRILGGLVPATIMAIYTPKAFKNFVGAATFAAYLAGLEAAGFGAFTE